MGVRSNVVRLEEEVRRERDKIFSHLKIYLKKKKVLQKGTKKDKTIGS